MQYKVAEIILPVPLPVYFSYLIPESLDHKLKEGRRAIVPFGKSRIHTGIIRKIISQPLKTGNLKSVFGIIDDEDFIGIAEMEIWEWIAFYYNCEPGEVYKAAVPSYFRNFEDVKILFNSGEQEDMKNLIDQEGMKNAVKTLRDKQSEISDFKFSSSLQPFTSYYKRLFDTADKDKILESLKSATAQQKIIKIFAKNDKIKAEEIEEKTGVSKASVKKAEKNGLIEKFEEKNTLHEQTFNFSLPDLNKWQKKALDEIKTGFKEEKVCLLHGITSSGKTLIYLRLIKEVISEGKQVLFLLPEIALTTQIIERLRKLTGTDIEVFHSRSSGKSRLRLWENVKSGKAKMVVGARSAVFLPFKEPGLIVIDEEHDYSFKQTEPAPRYNARDVAVYYANKLSIPLVMGSATPSAESYYNALRGKYKLVELKHRYKDMPVTDIQLLDVRHARKRKVMKGDFHPQTLSEIGKVLKRKGQVIILRNRKGYAPVLKCADCGWTASCPNCSVHLTYHKKTARLKCHHCSYSEKIPAVCPDCGNANIKYFGFGTQKVEEDIKTEFSQARISRFDQDSLTSAKEYVRNINDFENHKTDILVGTQILSKGLDFENVRLIVVLHADQMLNFPDFRSFERAYQMLEQVSGRTGRHHEDAQVLMQTSFPDHPVLKSLINHNYKKLITDELRERRELHYPPFVHLIHIHIKTKNPYIIEKRSVLLFKELNYEFGGFVSEPAIPVLEKQSGMYQRFIQVRFPKDKKLMKRKKVIRKIVSGYAKSSAGRGLRIISDVDPG